MHVLHELQAFANDQNKPGGLQDDATAKKGWTKRVKEVQRRHKCA